MKILVLLVVVTSLALSSEGALLQKLHKLKSDVINRLTGRPRPYHHGSKFQNYHHEETFYQGYPNSGGFSYVGGVQYPPISTHKSVGHYYGVPAGFGSSQLFPGHGVNVVPPQTAGAQVGQDYAPTTPPTSRPPVIWPSQPADPTTTKSPVYIRPAPARATTPGPVYIQLSTTKAPVYVRPATTKAPVYVRPATTKPLVYVRPATTKPPVYVRPATTKPPVYVRPATTKPPVYVRPATTKPPVYVRPATTKPPVYVRPATTKAPVYVRPATTKAPIYLRPRPTAPAPLPHRPSAAGYIENAVRIYPSRQQSYPSTTKAPIYVRPIPTTTKAPIYVRPLPTTTKAPIYVRPIPTTTKAPIYVRPIPTTTKTPIYVRPIPTTTKAPIYVRPIPTTTKAPIYVRPIPTTTKAPIYVRPLPTTTETPVYNPGPVASGHIENAIKIYPIGSQPQQYEPSTTKAPIYFKPSTTTSAPVYIRPEPTTTTTTTKPPVYIKPSTSGSVASGHIENAIRRYPIGAQPQLYRPSTTKAPVYVQPAPTTTSDVVYFRPEPTTTTTQRPVQPRPSHYVENAIKTYSTGSEQSSAAFEKVIFPENEYTKPDVIEVQPFPRPSTITSTGSSTSHSAQGSLATDNYKEVIESNIFEGTTGHESPDSSAGQATFTHGTGAGNAVQYYAVGQGQTHSEGTIENDVTLEQGQSSLGISGSSTGGSIYSESATGSQEATESNVSGSGLYVGGFQISQGAFGAASSGHVTTSGSGNSISHYAVGQEVGTHTTGSAHSSESSLGLTTGTAHGSESSSGFITSAAHGSGAGNAVHQYAVEQGASSVQSTGQYETTGSVDQVSASGYAGSVIADDYGQTQTSASDPNFTSGVVGPLGHGIGAGNAVSQYAVGQDSQYAGLGSEPGYGSGSSSSQQYSTTGSQGSGFITGTVSQGATGQGSSSSTQFGSSSGFVTGVQGAGNAVSQYAVGQDASFQFDAAADADRKIVSSGSIDTQTGSNSASATGTQVQGTGSSFGFAGQYTGAVSQDIGAGNAVSQYAVGQDTSSAHSGSSTADQEVQEFGTSDAIEQDTFLSGQTGSNYASTIGTQTQGSGFAEQYTGTVYQGIGAGNAVSQYAVGQHGTSGAAEQSQSESSSAYTSSSTAQDTSQGVGQIFSSGESTSTQTLGTESSSGFITGTVSQGAGNAVTQYAVGQDASAAQSGSAEFGTATSSSSAATQTGPSAVFTTGTQTQGTGSSSTFTGQYTGTVSQGVGAGNAVSQYAVGQDASSAQYDSAQSGSVQDFSTSSTSGQNAASFEQFGTTGATEQGVISSGSSQTGSNSVYTTGAQTSGSSSGFTGQYTGAVSQGVGAGNAVSQYAVGQDASSFAQYDAAANADRDFVSTGSVSQAGSNSAFTTGTQTQGTGSSSGFTGQYIGTVSQDVGGAGNAVSQYAVGQDASSFAQYDAAANADRDFVSSGSVVTQAGSNTAFTTGTQTQGTGSSSGLTGQYIGTVSQGVGSAGNAVSQYAVGQDTSSTSTAASDQEAVATSTNQAAGQIGSTSAYTSSVTAQRPSSQATGSRFGTGSGNVVSQYVISSGHRFTSGESTGQVDQASADAALYSESGFSSSSQGATRTASSGASGLGSGSSVTRYTIGQGSSATLDATKTHQPSTEQRFTSSSTTTSTRPSPSTGTNSGSFIYAQGSRGQGGQRQTITHFSSQSVPVTRVSSSQSSSSRNSVSRYTTSSDDSLGKRIQEALEKSGQSIVRFSGPEFKRTSSSSSFRQQSSSPHVKSIYRVSSS